jgi:hypothetical protein
MSYLTVLTFILLGILVLAISHVIWRGQVNIFRKIFTKIFGDNHNNRGKKKFIYGDKKYKNQQLRIDIVSFFAILFLVAMFILFPDMGLGYQIILILAWILGLTIMGWILMFRKK